MKKRFIALILAMMMVFLSIPVSPSVTEAAASSEELLDIGFGGAFSTDKGYTSATGEIMYGDVNRRAGTEQLVFGEGVVLNGGTQGIEFLSNNSYGTTTVNDAFVVEAKFKPQANQAALGTIIGVMGNMYARYQSATRIEYGFAVNNNGTWAEYRGNAAAPETGKEHSLALVYQPAANGAVLRAFLNGAELTPATSTNGRAAISGGGSGKFSFGNEVHTAGLSRGFKGSISQAVVTSFEGEFDSSLLKTMELSKIDRSLMAMALGTLSDGNYTPSADELVLGQVAVTGGQVTGLGRIDMSGDNSRISFTSATALVQNGVLANHYVAEISAHPSALKPGATLIDLAGAVQLRRSAAGEKLEVLVNGQQAGTFDITGKLTGEFNQVTLLYRNLSATQAEVAVWWGNEQLGNAIPLNALPIAAHNSVMYGGGATGASSASMDGEIYGVAFGKLTGQFKSGMLGLSGGPCILPEGLEPGNRIAIRANECPAAIAAKASLARPEPRQVAWQQYEQTAFLHYGINTYYGVEWGNFNEDPNRFQPTDLDTDQWARTLKESGFKMAILTVKHHDGFLLYPSRYTDFDVASSTWRDGNGDVLREFVDSMRKYGIKVGVYLSPSDHREYTKGKFGNGSPRQVRTIPTLVEGDDRAGDASLPTFQLPATDYGAIMLNELYEVLTQYGEIDEVWFDGSQGNIPGNRAENYDWDSYYSLIRELAPNAVIAVQGEDVRWVGNESGRARENEWSVLGAKMNANGIQSYYPSYQSSDLGSRAALAGAAANGMNYLTWWPAEVDVSIRPGWFYHANQSPKSVAQLRDIYYQSIARNSVLLLNIPPDTRGQFADADVARLKEWHQQMKREFAINHTEGAAVTGENGAQGANPSHVNDGSYDTSWSAASTEASSLTFKLGSSVTVDKVLLQEDIRQGQQVESFAIDVRRNGQWEQIAASGVIGYKRVVLLPQPVTGQEFRVRILSSRGPVYLSEVGFYQTGAPLADKTQLNSLMVEAQMIHDNADTGTNVGQYPQAAKQALAAAIRAANGVSKNASSTQQQVNEAITALQAAIDTFEASVIVVAEVSASLTGPATVQEGSGFAVRFGLNHVSEDAFAEDVTIQYDPAVMEFVSARALLDGVQLLETKTIEPGKVRFILASTGQANAVTGNAELLELRFVAKEATETVTGTIETAGLLLANETGAESSAAAASIAVEVTLSGPAVPGDVNDDGKVSIGDLGIAAAHYGKSKQSSPDWEQVRFADVNGDEIIDIADIAEIARKLLS
ncbi:alpha-L-fucosidase [Paenibacillus sp. LHD-117]|uniref:alpha-L-fucosidase n=1 Tax=Paenibacillus sp. LHD-117 TaxID=3071412 RepID=UPI0027DF51F7|nr:alpha-L-fucosidase [Paenibacillus sp. LHD-117]MDQ6422161.1 alpha-L-fucosidase [Paenibacillus sp. LHD-117]